MIKRISILVRRPQDTRETFTKHWHGTHGPLVAQLPAIAAYTQNHVESLFSVLGVDDYEIDGVVELYFTSEETYHSAFACAEDVWRDEPNFLTHSTAYRIEDDCSPPTAFTDAKLIVAAAGEPGAILWLGDRIKHGADSAEIQLDRVAQVVPRTTMARGPQLADAFFHVRLKTGAVANQTAQHLVLHMLADCRVKGVKRLAVAQVVERAIIQ